MDPRIDARANSQQERRRRDQLFRQRRFAERDLIDEIAATARRLAGSAIARWRPRRA